MNHQSYTISYKNTKYSAYVKNINVREVKISSYIDVWGLTNKFSTPEWSHVLELLQKIGHWYEVKDQQRNFGKSDLILISLHKNEVFH